MIEQGLSDSIHETDDTIECPICFLVSFERERKRRKKIIIHFSIILPISILPGAVRIQSAPSALYRLKIALNSRFLALFV
jgi:hypothetical protein